VNGKKMTLEERNKLVQLRIKAKTGNRLTREEQDWVEEMWRRYPKDYPSDQEIFEQVKKLVNPFL